CLPPPAVALFISNFSTMRNTCQKVWAGIFFLFTLSTLPLQAAPEGFPSLRGAPGTCPTPTNVTVTAQSSSSISFVWDAMFGAGGYRIWYYRQQDNYTSTPVSTSNNYTGFSSLPAGRYTFYFTTDCDTELSQPAIIIDIIMY